MLGSLRSCLTALRKGTKSFLQSLTAMERVRDCMGRKKKGLSSSFDDQLISSFASMELCNQFKQVFKVIDANGDGKISSQELSEVLLCLGYDKSKATKHAEGMVREMDCNGDGFIDLDEFIVAVNDDGEPGSSDKKEYLMDAFLIFDSDKNGVISARGLQKVLSKLGCDNCSLQECKRMIKGVDKDGDGFVDFEEFRSMMTASAK